MKKKGRLILLLFILCCFYAIVYYLTYNYIYNDLTNNKLYDESQLKPKEITEEYSPVIR